VIPRTADVLVIGGGVIGCAVARELAGPGRSVVLVDRGALGAEASGAAAGVLAVASGGETDAPGLALRRASLALYPALAAALAEETGIDVEYARSGVLELAFDEEAGAASARIAACAAAGLRAEWVDPGALAEAAPGANPAARGGILFPDDAQVTNPLLVEALAAAARRRGAAVVPGAEVSAAERTGERITRVRVNADWCAPGTVVLAAGAWAARVAGLAPGLGVVPARGQMLALRPPALPSAHVLSAADGYLVPRRSGEVLVGATVEDAGFEKAVTPAGLTELLAKVARIAPALAGVPVARVWAGLRPWAPAGGPILGRVPGTSNLVVACGHHRQGILLAPITAAVVAAAIEERPPLLDVGAFVVAPASGR
jgi:glycine oxidase